MLFLQQTSPLALHFHEQWIGDWMPCQSKSAPTEVTHCPYCWNAPSTTSLYLHLLFGLHQHSASINKCQWEQFFLHGGIKWHPFWFIRTSMSEAIWSGCPSAAICHTATKHYGILVGRFNLYCHTTNICLRCWSCAKILT